jgi:D-serine deaminase-like pyridoxal phosphate-dependent protein
VQISDVPTPALILDRRLLTRNCAAMAERMRHHNVRLRPHLKTAKSAEIAALATSGQFGGITVSTLAEARYFVEQGYRDITYAVGIVPSKLDEVAELQKLGAQITLLTDNLDVVPTASDRAAASNTVFRMLIEIDTGGGRAGLPADSSELLDLGRAIDAAPGLSLEGVLTHAGHSYHCKRADEVRQVAEAERLGITLAARRLRELGLPCREISAGSTPTAVLAERLDGVTEMRPGAYVFFDLDQVGIGVCTLEDIAVTVLATVIGHNRRTKRVLIDAGALALSKDLSATEFMSDVGYGLVCPIDSTLPYPGLYVAETYQEHGLIAANVGEPPYDSLPLGTKVRILPNHACITAAAHSTYFVIEGGTEVIDRWGRVNGW